MANRNRVAYNPGIPFNRLEEARDFVASKRIEIETRVYCVNYNLKRICLLNEDKGQAERYLCKDCGCRNQIKFEEFVGQAK